MLSYDFTSPHSHIVLISVVAGENTHMCYSNQVTSFITLLTAAEDNQYRDYPAWAASFFPDCILAVAALSPDNDQLTGFSNFGQVVRIAAPVSEGGAVVVGCTATMFRSACGRTCAQAP
jgi:hypothetical protein